MKHFMNTVMILYFFPDCGHDQDLVFNFCKWRFRSFSLVVDEFHSKCDHYTRPSNHFQMSSKQNVHFLIWVAAYTCMHILVWYIHTCVSYYTYTITALFHDIRLISLEAMFQKFPARISWEKFMSILRGIKNAIFLITASYWLLVISCLYTYNQIFRQ